MSCEEIRNLALLAACGEAGESEAAVVRQHAAHCPACTAEIRTLHEGLELLNHVPAEEPSAETRAALGALLMREAPRAMSGPATASRPAWFWAAAAAVLLVAAAGGMAWKLMTPGTQKPTVIATHPEGPAPKPVPVPTPTPKPAPKPKVVDPALAWAPTAHDDIDSLSDTIKDLRGGSVAVQPKFDRTTVWVPQATRVDSMYESLDSITTTSDKF
ncbi:MAG: hypothetical protein K8T20_13735 [Planctomycetes bacterium]|nr:hypothetical protein [Planctomycetota bacterium]